MKNLEMIIRKETKRGERFYKYGSCSTRLFPVKRSDVELMMAEGTIEIVDAEGNVIWTPALEEVAVETVEVEVDETVIDCTGINFNDINDIHKIVDTETLPEVIQGFIQSCTRFAFDQNTLILYRERKAVASASFFVAGGIAHILDMGAGDVFQWDSIKGFEESQPVEIEEGSDDIEVKKVVKAIQIIKENFELGMNKEDIKDLYSRAVQIYGKVIEDNIPQRIKDFIN